VTDKTTEFFNVTQYGRDYVIGRNCRFLSGPKTSRRAIERMRQAMKNGQEVCETLVNYRRDGSPFMNLLMIAPLYDNKGVIRYFIGCQIDVSPLIEGGRGIQSFSQLLAQDRAQSRFGKRFRSPKQTLGELTDLFSEEDTDVIRGHITRASISQTVTSVDSERLRRPQSRARILVGVGKEPANDNNLWPMSSLGPSGRLPGVYQNVSQCPSGRSEVFAKC
jgi:PAS domain S-box-containing protein